MSALEFVQLWAVSSSIMFFVFGVIALAFVDLPNERRVLARAALASPLWPLIPLLLVVLMVLWAREDK